METTSIHNPIESLLAEVRGCMLCREALPLGPRPILRAHPAARILIIGQAPGTRVHETGVPWNDLSGVRLRQWLGVSPETFYDESCFAIVPMGFCYPGRNARGGDLPPRPECAPRWHQRLLDQLPAVALTILIGRYAHEYYLAGREHKQLADTVRHWRDYAPRYLPTPHPSPRNIRWLKQNAWFEQEVVPALQERVHDLLKH